MSFMNSIIVDNPIVGERANDFYESVDDMFQKYPSGKLESYIVKRINENPQERNIETKIDRKVAFDRALRKKVPKPFNTTKYYELDKEPTFSSEDLMVLIYARLHRYRIDDINNEYSSLDGGLNI